MRRRKILASKLVIRHLEEAKISESGWWWKVFAVDCVFWRYKRVYTKDAVIQRRWLAECNAKTKSQQTKNIIKKRGEEKRDLLMMYVSVEKPVCFTVVWVLLFYIGSWWWASLLLVRLRRRQTDGMVTQAHEWWGKPLLYLKSCCCFFCAALVAKSPPGISFAQWNSFMAVPRAPVEEPQVPRLL